MRERNLTYFVPLTGLRVLSRLAERMVGDWEEDVPAVHSQIKGVFEATVHTGAILVQKQSHISCFFLSQYQGDVSGSHSCT